MDEMKNREFRQTFNSDQLRVAVAIGLRNARKDRKMTQQQVADIAGVTQSMIARAENPDKGMTLDQMVKVADGLGLVPKITLA